MINIVDKYFQRNDDAVLADKLMRFGQKLAVWLTNSDDLTTFHLIHYSDDGLCIDGVLQENLNWQSDFFAWATYKQAEFILPILDPVFERDALQNSLTQALNECDSYKSMLDGVNEACARRQAKLKEQEQIMQVSCRSWRQRSNHLLMPKFRLKGETRL
jgi:hypothetical protein